MRSRLNGTTLLALALLAIAPASPAQIEQRCVLMVDRFEDTTNLPQFHPVFDQALTTDGLLQFDIDTSSPAEQAGLSWRLSQAPPGMSIDPASGLVTWTPGALDVGVIAATAVVTDPQGRSNRHTFCVEVIDPNSAPRIAAIADRTILAEVAFALTVEAIDADPDDELTLTLDAAPPGMSLDPSSGLLAWLPGASDIGTFNVTVRATDPGGRFDLESFSLSVIDDNSAPALDPIADRGARANALFTLTATASDPDNDDLNWSLPQAPAGMAIHAATGLISWTPVTQQLGPHPVTVSVADPQGFADATDFSVFVDFNRAPVAIDDTDYRVERGDTLSIPPLGVLANDEDPNDDPLTAQLETGPQRGSLTLNADGSFDYTPDNPVGTIGFDEKWTFTAGSGGNFWPVIIANLDDDPQAEILSLRGSGSIQTVHALDGISGEVEWEITFGAAEISGNTRPAIADINGDGRPEILMIGGERRNGIASQLRLIAISHDGHIQWISEELPEWFYMDGERRGSRSLRASAIAVADLDQDGIPEIIAAPDKGPAGFHVWDHEGRTLASVHEPDPSIGDSILDAARTRITLVDLDLDGDLEIVVGDTAWHHDGTLIWKLGLESAAESAFPIVVNLDDDPYPELVRTRGQGASSPNSPTDLLAINHDGTILWEAPRPGHSHTTTFDTAPITAADVNGDGYANILRTYPIGSDLFEVLDGRDGSILWSKNVPTRGSGATAIDLDGDGFLEVVLFGGDAKLYVWDGRDGTEKGVFDATEFPNVPGPNTVPVFADIDADGKAELILSQANTSAVVPAIIVLESPNDDWPPMRSIWNQVPYHVTNINNDLSVPAVQRPHWLLPGLNQYMINERLPESRIEDADFFTYRASDGELLSNEARVELTILPPNSPPRILSTPLTLASPGFEYRYNVLAVDADVGESLNWTIAEGPSGMVVNDLGSVTWTPAAADLGSHPVVIEVADSIGARAFQSFVLTVVPAVTVPDLAGRTEAEAIADLTAASLLASPILDTFSDSIAEGRVAAQNPAAGTPIAAGAAVRIDISRGPVPVSVPRLTGRVLDDALSALSGAGLGAVTVWVNDAATPRGLIRQQDPAPGTPVVPGSEVALVVSGGPRAVISIDPPLIIAGDSATVTVEIRNSAGIPLDPQPAVTIDLEFDPSSIFGTEPTFDGTHIETSVDTLGAFEVLAFFDTGKPEVMTARAAVLPSISDGPNGDVYSDFTRHLVEFNALITELVDAIDAGDPSSIELLDLALSDLEQRVDVRRLRTMTVMAPEGGVPPSPAQAQLGGLDPGPVDNAYVAIGQELIVLLEALDQVVREGTAADQVLNQLNQDLATAASALGAIEPSTIGVLRAAPEITVLLGTYAPRMLAADIQAVRQSLQEGGFIAANGSVQSARFTLPGIMTASQIRQSIVSDFYVPYLGQVARALGTVIAADLLQPYVNGGAVVGIITGSSLAIHVFEIPNSVIEGFGFDPKLSPNNAVTMIGPSLIDSVSGALGGLPGASDFRDLNSIMDTVQSQIDNADSLLGAWNDANSVPNGTRSGCILDGTPGCGQLIYPDGFTSVYSVDGGLSLPAPVAILVRNLESGGMALFIANFVATKEDND